MPSPRLGLGNCSREQPRPVNGYLTSSQEHIDVALRLGAVLKRRSEVKVTAHVACMHFVQTKQPRLCSASRFTFHSLNYTAEHVCCHELAQVMVITVLHWSAKHHVHQGRFTDTCRIDADLELKQTLTMICEAYIPLFAPPSTTCIPDQYRLTTSKATSTPLLNQHYSTTSHTGSQVFA